MHAFNAACTWIAAYAFQHCCASKFQLQKALYYEVRQRFGLSAQLAIRAIAKTVEAYKRDKSQQVAFRPEGAVVYDERIMAFHGLEEVSLTTLQGPYCGPHADGRLSARPVSSGQRSGRSGAGQRRHSFCS